MKILYLCSWYRNDPSSFAGVFFAEQAAVFAEHGHEVALACGSSLSLKAFRPAKRFSLSPDEPLTRNTSSKVYRSEFRSAPARFQSLRSLQMRRGYQNFLKKVVSDFGRPDVVHIQSALYAGVFSYQWLVENNIPYIVTEHATMYRRGLVKQHFVRSIKDCFSNSFQANAVSTSLKQDLEKIGVNTPIVIVPNVYDDRMFLPPSSRDCSGRFSFLLVCGLDKKKGVDVALNAMAQVTAKYPTAKLFIAGDGVEFESLLTQTKDLDLENNVVFLGRCSRNEVAHQMVSCHCLLSTSYFETFGVTLIEALACGLPVIATRSGGPEDFVKSPYGELVAVGDKYELAAAMIRMIDTYDYSSEAIRERHKYALINFGSDALYETLLPVYEEAAASKRSIE